MGNTGQILSGQNMTPWFLMCSIFLNILTILANFPGLIIQFSQKTSVVTVATLLPIQVQDPAVSVPYTYCKSVYGHLIKLLQQHS